MRNILSVSRLCGGIISVNVNHDMYRIYMVYIRKQHLSLLTNA